MLSCHCPCDHSCDCFDRIVIDFMCKYRGSMNFNPVFHTDFNSLFLFVESRASFMTTSNASEHGELAERESLSQANIELQAEKILKVGLDSSTPVLLQVS